jgi:O-antigen/teichoic acid export membrane protein
MSIESNRRESKVFIRDTIIVAATQILLKLRGLVAMPLIIKLLGVAAFGVWSQVFAFTSLLASLLSLNLHLPLVREIAADRTRASATFSSVLSVILSLSLIASVGTAVFAPTISTILLADGSVSKPLRIGAFLIVLTALRSINMNLYRALGLFAKRSLVELAISFGELLIIVVVLVKGGDLSTVLTMVVAWEGLLVTAQTIHCVRTVGVHRPQKAVILSALRFALPAVPASLSVWILDRIDRFVIGNYLGADAVGVYSASYTLGSAIMFFQLPLQVTLFPRVSSLWDTNRSEAKRYIEISSAVFIAAAIPFGLLLLISSEDLLRLLGNEGVALGNGMLPPLISLGVIFWGISTMQMQALLASRKSMAVAKITGIGATLNLVLNIVLVPRNGITGSAIATVVSYAATCLIFARTGEADVRVKLWNTFLTRTLMVTIVSATVGLALTRHSARTWMPAFASVFLYCVLQLSLDALWPASRMTVGGLLSLGSMFRRTGPPAG